jgi:hypothetical protein
MVCASSPLMEQKKILPCSEELIRDLGPGDLLLLDRGYPEFELFELLLDADVDLLAGFRKLVCSVLSRPSFNKEEVMAW